MRKVKSTALLGAFVAVASVGVISHEAHGSTLTTTSYYISKEMLPSSVTLSTPVINSTVTASGATVTLTLSGANFINNSSYSIVNAPASMTCTANGYGTSSATFTSCTLSNNTSYTIVGGGATTSFVVDGSPAASSIAISYSSNVSSNGSTDTAGPATLAQVMQQLSVSPNSVTQAVISPSSLSTFTNGTSISSATNSVVISNSAYNNSMWKNTITPSITMNFLFSSIPSSVTSVGATDVGNTTNVISSATPANNSATVTASFSVASGYPFQAGPSDTISFAFSNSGNIQPGTIVLSSITGVTSSTSYVYLSTPQNFLTFTFGGTQIYIPDALAHSGSNVIQYSYITISMPSSASIASISVLNVSGASCPVPSLANGLLQSTSTTGVYYIDLSQLAQACTGISSVAWQSGVPLVINITGTNATPNNITADAYAVFAGMLKRIPVAVVNIGAGTANFSY